MESRQKVLKEESIATSTDRAASSHAFPVSQEEEFSPEETTKKCCSDCRTTKTPLWRSGPSGPKSLCNACGIRYRKKRPAAAAPPPPKGDGKKGKLGKRRNLMPVGQEIEVGKRLSSPREWGEVERAALLLMALSCGAVFA